MMPNTAAKNSGLRIPMSIERPGFFAINFGLWHNRYMRNSPSDINPILEQITTKWHIDAADAGELLRRYDANKNKILNYSQKNLDLFRRMLSIETNDRYFGTPDIMLLRSIVKSQAEGILDGTDSHVSGKTGESGAPLAQWEKTRWKNSKPENIGASRLALEGKGDWSSIRLAPPDLNSVAKMVKAEAGWESEEWQKAVLNVMFNRVLDGRFGKWIQGVLFKPGQFSPVSDGRFARSSLDKEIIALVADFLKAWDNPLDDALFFQVNGIKNGWINRTQRKIATIGNHSFFGPKEEDPVVAQKKGKNEKLVA